MLLPALRAGPAPAPPGLCCTRPRRWLRRQRLVHGATAMAVAVEGARRKERILCLFDVDGTLTPARQVRVPEVWNLPPRVKPASVTQREAVTTMSSQTPERPGRKPGVQWYRLLSPRRWDPGPLGLPGLSAPRAGWHPRSCRERRCWIQPPGGASVGERAGIPGSWLAQAQAGLWDGPTPF